jgi:hypothetical protein
MKQKMILPSPPAGPRARARGESGGKSAVGDGDEGKMGGKLR